jgi:hypothetical protein
MASSRLRTGKLTVRPVARFSPFDSSPLQVRALIAHSPRSLASASGVSEAIARRVITQGRKRPIRNLADLLELGLTRRDALRLQRSILFTEDERIVIQDVQPLEGRIMSDRPFALRIAFASATPHKGVARVLALWAGEPFSVEKILTEEDSANGYVDIPFDDEQTLPSGPATFHASLTTALGTEARFQVSCLVLPSNPFSLWVSPRTNYVTGTYSARAVRQGSNFITDIGINLSNGDGNAVAVERNFTWEFWDGGVGSGSLVESGTGSFSGPINVPAFGSWSGWIVFTSPSGSGVFGKLDAREDLTLNVVMTRVGAAPVSGTITVRTMFRFGLNITRVGAESFTPQEYSDLYAAVDVTRSIYERRDLTLSVDRRYISNAQAGGFTVVTSESEARDLFEQWSGPDNDFIDVFVTNISGTSFDGLAGDIPGPTSHSGRESGVVVSRSGYVDSAGNPRLNIPYLGMLIAHEVGHYLGLQHVNDAGNLMLWNSGATDTALNYNPQYRTIIQHGWVRID